jgi:hypothetical protein
VGPANDGIESVAISRSPFGSAQEVAKAGGHNGVVFPGELAQGTINADKLGAFCGEDSRVMQLAIIVLPTLFEFGSVLNLALNAGLAKATDAGVPVAF